MVRVGIVGASGYTGSELIRFLLNHSKAELTYVTAHRYVGQKVSSLYPNFAGVCDLVYRNFPADGGAAEAKEAAEVLFIALPHGASMEVVAQVLDGEHKIIDLSGDFRFADKEIYESWYGMPHKCPTLLGMAVYGLPEVNRKAIKGTNFVSNPGCYPTGAILATAPLLAKGLVLEQDIIIDALTGVSGSGRAAKENTHYCYCDENVSSYKVGGVHQHIPEMEQEMSKIAGEEVRISFTPHLAPFSRGIYTTAYCNLKKDLSTTELIKIFSEFYEGEYFVKVLPEGEYPQVKSVAGSNFCHIGLKVDERTGRVIVISAIDNLAKGASGQAIQNMNIMCGFDETEGLTGVGLMP